MEVNYSNMLQSCGGRLSIDDATALYKAAMDISAKNIVEIGAAGGCSSMILALVAREIGGKLYSIDPRREGRWYTNMEGLELMTYVKLINEASPWVSADEFPATIDLLFIDGNHRTKWCITDYQYFQHYVRKGGYIAFHDWTGAGGYGAQVKRAIAIILETDKLREVERVEGKDKGLIIFEKTW